MKLERLLELAGVELSEDSLARYNEPKANHTKKCGGEEKKAKDGKGKSTKKSKYSEPKANHAVKSGGEAKKAPEGKSKVPSTAVYKDHNSTK